MNKDAIIYLFFTGLASLYLVKLFIIKKYHNLNIDQYNHNAFIKSLSTNFKLKVSALRETNTYPFLIHMFMDKVKNNYVKKYFSFSIEIIFLLLISWYLYSIDIEIQNILPILIILSVSTTSFSQVRFFSARTFGIALFNCILLVTYTDLDFGIKIVLEVLCLIPIFLASKFAHQAFVFVVIPAAILFLKTDILISYPLALVISYIMTNGFVVRIFKAHITHCYYTFFYNMDLYVFGHYYREFESKKVDRKEFSVLRTVRSLFGVIKNPVLVLIPLLFLYGSNLEIDFNILLILIVTGIYILLSICTRLNWSVGEAGRYFEYILVPLAFSSYNYGLFDIKYFYIILILIIFASFSWVVFLIGRENKSIRLGGRVYDNKESNELISFLKTLRKSRVASLPIAISNFLALNSEHEYYYPFSYLSQYFLQRKGILPFFKFDNSNLLNKKYIDYLVVDVRQIPQEYLEQIINKYKYSLIFHNAIYQVYQKIK